MDYLKIIIEAVAVNLDVEISEGQCDPFAVRYSN
jgi:hypothetical protein